MKNRKTPECENVTNLSSFLLCYTFLGVMEGHLVLDHSVPGVLGTF